MIGRNDLCPCGSGKKFKRCCGEASKQAETVSLSAAIAAALKHHNAGRLAEAEALYWQILQAKPDHTDALHYLGVIAYQAGKLDAAAELIGKATRIHPTGEMHSNLGLVLQAQGQLDAAVGHYRRALVIQPDYAEAHNNLGNALKDKGELDSAAEHYRRALALRPTFAEAHYNLGLVLNLRKQLEALLTCTDSAFGTKIDHVESHKKRDLRLSPHSRSLANNIISTILQEGIKHHQAGRLSRAETFYQYARQIMDDAPDALHLLGMIAYEMGRTELSLDLIGRAIALNSSEPSYVENLEMVRTTTAELAQADLAYAATPIIEIVSATRMTESEFWNESALGVSLRSLALDTRLVANIAFENRRGLPDVFNERINDPVDRQILVFIHDDVWIDDFFFADRLIHGIETYDVIGVAGTRRRVKNQPGWGHIAYVDGNLEPEETANLCGGIAHGSRPFGVISAFGATRIAQCELMDGVFIAASKSRLVTEKVQFDSQFDFHFYDVDFCRSASENGLRLGTWPIHLTHQSEGAFRSAGWKNMYRVYLEKWKS